MHEHAADQPVALRHQSERTHPLRFVRDVLLILVIGVLVAFLIRTFLVRTFSIPSESMAETLQVGDRVVVTVLVPDVVPLNRGDIVVFTDPGGWLEPATPIQQNPLSTAANWMLSLLGLSDPDNNNHIIKRVIGLPGDQVACCNALGQLSVNGTPIQEPYLDLPAGSTRASGIDFDQTVPEGALWVLGDNRNNSTDSRYNRDTPGKGFVPVDHVVGRALVVSWPLSHWAWINDYPDVFSTIPPAESMP